MKQLILTNHSYKELVNAFKTWLDILGYAESTVYYLPNHLQEFFYYLECHQYNTLDSVNLQTVKDYYTHLQCRANQRRSGALSKSYLNKHQQALKKFKEFLKSHKHQGIKLHLKTESEPSKKQINILTQTEIKSLFRATDYSHSEERFKLRDKALLVVLYSCGLRRTEAVHLDLGDIHFDKERIHVRKAKNYKERFVPFNAKSASLLEEYIYEGRPDFYKAKASEALLINYRGARMGGMSLANRLQAIIRASEDKNIEEKKITPHSLRHSIATHLLEQNVPLEAIKTFLGHTSLESTQIYTHLIEKQNNIGND